MPDTAPIAVPDSARRIIDALEAAGETAWLVGGCVRDALAGNPVHDIDITTSARWKTTADICRAAGMAVFETGTAHGTVTVVVDDERFEVTTYRIDGDYSDARHPDSVTFVDDVDDDLARRDFTVNAMAYHPDRGLRDPFGGRADLAAGIIRAVGCPTTRFEEDALRILRALRFASRFGFDIDADTLAGMRAGVRGLDRVAAERIRVELEGMLEGEAVCETMMAYHDILYAVLPELECMWGLDQLTQYHIYDVYEHTAHVVANTPPYPLARWTALFHDMGKPAAFFTDDDGVGHFYGHAKISCDIARGIMGRLRFANDLRDDVLLLVLVHDDVIEARPKPVKRMLRRLGGRVDLFHALCDIKRADARSQAPQCIGRVALADELEACLETVIAEHQAFSLRDLAVDGSDVIACGVEAGPEVGRILAGLLDDVIDERIENDRDTLIARIEAQLP